MQFEAPWGLHLKIMTICGSLVCVGIPLYLTASNHQEMGSVMFGLMQSPILLWLVCLLLSVRGYSITADHILIHRLIWVTRIPLEDLQSFDFDQSALRQSIRYFGNGGIFAICGLYRHRRLGIFRAFVTDTGRSVMLRFRSRAIIVSPDDPHRFVKVLLRSTYRLSPAVD
jgi:hypothetical protein